MVRASRGHRAFLSFALVLALSATDALAQAGGGSSSGGSAGGGASSAGSTGAGASRGGAAGGIGAPAPRVGPGSTSDRSTIGTDDPRRLSNQPATAASPGTNSPGTLSPGTPAPAGTTTPSGTAYPSGAPLDAARQRAMQGPAGTAIPPSAAGVGADRSRTSDVTPSSDEATEATTPGLPDQAPPERGTSGDPARATAGGNANRQGAVGKTMAECEAAWDAKTHMSKETWRATCRRTMTEPHL